MSERSDMLKHFRIESLTERGDVARMFGDKHWVTLAFDTFGGPVELWYGRDSGALIGAKVVKLDQARAVAQNIADMKTMEERVQARVRHRVVLGQLGAIDARATSNAGRITLQGLCTNNPKPDKWLEIDMRSGRP